jgi:diadenylate cyclase
MGFLIPSLTDIIDILLLSVIIYRVLLLVKNVGGLPILFWLGVIVVASGLSSIFHLRMIGSMLTVVRNHWFLALLILFQPEIRSFLVMAAQSQTLRLMFTPHKKMVFASMQEAVTSMAFRRIGALIVLENKQKLDKYIATGEIIDARLTTKLLLTVFNPRTILHDGAVVIRENRIYAVKVILPISHKPENVQRFGTRHLAAIGVTEESDAVVVVVSEESGRISVVQNGEIHSNLSPEELALRIGDGTR